MKTDFITVWTPVVVAGILVILLADAAAASLKRVIVLDRPNIGFPPVTKTWQQQRLRLSELRNASEATTLKRGGEFSE